MGRSLHVCMKARKKSVPLAALCMCVYSQEKNGKVSLRQLNARVFDQTEKGIAPGNKRPSGRSLRIWNCKIEGPCMFSGKDWKGEGKKTSLWLLCVNQPFSFVRAGSKRCKISLWLAGFLGSVLCTRSRSLRDTRWNRLRAWFYLLSLVLVAFESHRGNNRIRKVTWVHRSGAKDEMDVVTPCFHFTFFPIVCMYGMHHIAPNAISVQSQSQLMFATHHVDVNAELMIFYFCGLNVEHNFAMLWQAQPSLFWIRVSVGPLEDHSTRCKLHKLDYSHVDTLQAQRVWQQGWMIWAKSQEENGISACPHSGKSLVCQWAQRVPARLRACQPVVACHGFGTSDFPLHVSRTFVLLIPETTVKTYV